MAISTIANLRIDKLKNNGFIHFVTLDLEQFIADHARVKIKIDLETFGENVLSNPMERIALINEKFQINIQTINEKEKATDVYDFLGIITDVQVELDAGKHGWMYIYGASQSIELERGKMLKTHSDKTLKDVVDEVIKNKVHVMVANNPEYTAKIPFSMQYYETDYQYIKRLAWMYGEKLVFNGNNLIFGKITKEYTTKLTYNTDLTEVKLNSRLISNRFSQYYHTLKEEKHSANFEIKEENIFTGVAGIQSDKLNQKDHMPDIPVATPVYDDESLEKLTEKRKQAHLNRMFYVSGKTNIYKTTIGDLLEIDFDKKMTVDESVGTLRVTRVLHSFDQNKRYENYFEACQKAFDHFPYEDIEIPIAQPITATVINNQDKEGLGRVQVVFDFENELCQHWLRCSTQDGGGNKRIGKERNRGIIFVPEIGDRVYLGFMEGNPDKPFVMGSFFHGNNASKLGGGKGNHIRSISDKANNYIQWNSAGGITIKDQAGSTIFLDGAGNINMSCPLTFTLQVGAGKDHENPKNGKNYASYRGASIEMDKMGVVKITGSDITLEATQANPNPEHVTLSEHVEFGSLITDNSTGLPVPIGNVNIRGLVHVDVDTDYQIDVHTKGIMNVHGDFKTTVTAGKKDSGVVATIREEEGKVHIN